MGQMAQVRLGRVSLVVASLIITACTSCGSARPAATFNNPLVATDGADPWLRTYQGNYYLTTTQWSTIRMWKASTLAGLTTAKPVTIWSDRDPARCCNVWAPEFHLLHGPDGDRWYMYYTAGSDGTLDNQRTNVLESSGTDPLGPYTYKGRIFDQQHDTWAIDGSVLNMANGGLYFLFSAFEGHDQSIFIAPMSNPWTISGPRVLLSTPTLPWEQSVAHVNEGPEALQHDGKTFIIYSASACWRPDYKLGMLTYSGGDVLSPGAWRKRPEPVFARADANGVFAPGHNGFFTSPDGRESWIVYHANSQATDGCTGVRTTRVQKFTWNADGTPNFGVPVSLDTAITVPSGENGTASPAFGDVAYALVTKAGSRCLGSAGHGGAGRTTVQLSVCGPVPAQQWSVSYLGNGYYAIRHPASGQALEVAGGSAAQQEGLPVQQSAWAHSTNQQWRFEPATDGWLRLEARASGKDIDVGTCGAGGEQGIHQQSTRDTDCQQFLLQPVDAVQIVNANSNKALSVEQGSTGQDVHVVLGIGTGRSDGRWTFVYEDSGFYQIKATTAGQCLGLAPNGAAGSAIGLGICESGAQQQWRFEPLNDGTVRLVARSTGMVLDVVNCRTADGTPLQEWQWLNNPCQRYHFAAP